MVVLVCTLLLCALTRIHASSYTSMYNVPLVLNSYSGVGIMASKIYEDERDELKACWAACGACRAV
jgi:hypothetical protein